MDNITHSLFGVAIADSLSHQESPTVKTKLRWISVLAANLPDFDFLYTRITEGKLGYVLHHRGHTHTLGLVIPLALLSVLLGVTIAKRRPSWEWGWRIHFAALLGVLSHTALDSLNIYGTHPLWPVSSEWYFGDSLFIIEPTLWIALAPLVLVTSIPSSRGIRILRTGLYALMGIAVAWTPLIPTLIKFVVLGMGVIWPLTVRRIRFRPLACSLFSIAVIVSFFFAGRRMDRRIRALEPQSLSIAKTPAPANPFCWQAWIRFPSSNGDYLVERATVSAWPAIISSNACPTRIRGRTSAALSKSDRISSDEITWTGSYRKSREEVVALRAHCEAVAFLKFSRLPYWTGGPGAWTIGDLRFDWDESLSFAEFIPSGRCPSFVPDWADASDLAAQ